MTHFVTGNQVKGHCILSGFPFPCALGYNEALCPPNNISSVIIHGTGQSGAFSCCFWLHVVEGANY